MNHESIELKCARWITPLVDPAARRKAVQLISSRIGGFPHYDAIAFTGLSGSILAGTIALTLDKYLYCVRKENESQVEGPSTGLRYIILDDFICTGSTVDRIVELVGKHTDGKAECVGVYLWRDDEKIDGERLKRYTANLPRHKPAEKPADPIDF